MCEEKHLEILTSYLVDLEVWEVWRFWMTCSWTFLGLLSVFSSISYCSYLLSIPLYSCKASWDWRQHGYFSNLTPEKNLFAIVFIWLQTRNIHRNIMFVNLFDFKIRIFTWVTSLSCILTTHKPIIRNIKSWVIDLYSTIEDAMGSFYSIKCPAPTPTRTCCPCPAVPSQLI